MPQRNRDRERSIFIWISCGWVLASSFLNIILYKYMSNDKIFIIDDGLLECFNVNTEKIIYVWFLFFYSAPARTKIDDRIGSTA